MKFGNLKFDKLKFNKYVKKANNYCPLPADLASIMDIVD